MLFHELLDAALKQRRMSRAALAARVSLGERAVGHWFSRGSLPDHATFELLCEALGLDDPTRAVARIELENALEAARAKQGTAGRKPAQPSAAPPTIPIPDRCWGRDTELRDLLAALITARATALLTGDGGMGKTTLAREAAHHPDLVKRFAHRRHEADLSAATSADAMQDAIALALGTKPAEGLPAIQRALSGAPHLLLLDNLETPWDAEPRAVQDLLGKLATLPDLSLVATLRWTKAPTGLRWTYRCALEPLDDAAARTLFRDIAPHMPDADPLWPDLLRQLAGIPLAIELVARRAEADRDLTRIWSEWQAQGPALADSEADPGHRQASLARSIGVSLASPRLKAEGWRLFRLLGALPAGLAREDEAPLLGEAAGEAVRQLQAVGLARPREGRLDLLPPVRRHARDRHPCTEEEAQGWVRHFLDLMRVEGEKVGWAGGDEALRRLTPEMDNLDAALAQASRLGLLSAACAGIRGYSLFGYFAGRAGAGLCALRAAASEAGDLIAEANCCEGLAQIALGRSDHEAARAGFFHAQRIFRAVGSRRDEANCTWRLAEISAARFDHEIAIAGYLEAQAIYLEVGAQLGEANCIKNLSDIAMRRAQWLTAQKDYKWALSIYKSLKNYLGEANCMWSLAEIKFRNCDYCSAIKEFDLANGIYKLIGDRLGHANCILRLADIAMIRKRNDLALRGYREALSIFREVSDRMGQANCHLGLAALTISRRGHEAARGEFEHALATSLEIAYAEGEGRALAGLAEVHAAKGDLAKAKTLMDEAIAVLERSEDAFHLSEVRAIQTRLNL